MGFWRTIYREARDVLGLPPPSETADQLAERIRDEVAGDLGGRKSRDGEGEGAVWVLTTALDEREVTLTFRPASLSVVYQVASTLGGGPAFCLVAETHSGASDEATRKAIGTGLNLEAPDAAELATLELLWKTLPTGTRQPDLPRPAARRPLHLRGRPLPPRHRGRVTDRLRGRVADPLAGPLAEPPRR